jgi:hypothetical protein
MAQHGKPLRQIGEHLFLQTRIFFFKSWVSTSLTLTKHDTGATR